MRNSGWWRRFWIGFFAVIAAWVLFIFFIQPAPALDHGFSALDPTPGRVWASKAHMPNSESSCCGKGDMYFSDIYKRNADGSYEAVITDGEAIQFPDGTYRIAIPNGTKFHIPADRVNPPKDGNPTGHGVVWLGVGAADDMGKIYNVWCFFPLPNGS